MAALVGSIVGAIRPCALRLSHRFGSAPPTRRMGWYHDGSVKTMAPGLDSQVHRAFVAARPKGPRPKGLHVSSSSANGLKQCSTTFHRSLAKGVDRKAIVILGWLGCKHRYLRRLQEWYNSMGYDTVVLVIPASTIINWDHTPLLQEIDSAVGLLQRLDADTRLVVHAFSHTGWLTLGLLLARGVRGARSIEGIIIDSAPGQKLNAQLLAKGISASLFRMADPAALSVLFLPLAHMFLSRSIISGLVRDAENELDSFLRDGASKREELYIFSSQDAIISQTEMAAHVNLRKKESYRVHNIVFSGAGHVQLYRNREAEYQDAIECFMRRCRM